MYLKRKSLLAKPDALSGAVNARRPTNLYDKSLADSWLLGPKDSMKCTSL